MRTFGATLWVALPLGCTESAASELKLAHASFFCSDSQHLLEIQDAEMKGAGNSDPNVMFLIQQKIAAENCFFIPGGTDVRLKELVSDYKDHSGVVSEIWLTAEGLATIIASTERGPAPSF